MKYRITKKQNNSARCVVCGNQNEFSLNSRFYELENGELAVIFRTEDHHQSYPGRTHGGLVAAVLDELIGRAMCIAEPEMWGVTVELTIRYRKPVPTDALVKGVARITKNSRKIFEGTGEVFLPDGTLAAEAWGKYMKMPLEKISGEGSLDEEWYFLAENDPEELEI